MRLNAEGEVVELVERTIPGGFFDWFVTSTDDLMLKPGAVGARIERGDANETLVTGGRAGIARKAAIDWDGMRRKARESFEARWDAVHAVAQGRTWETHAAIRARYPQPPNCDDAVEQAASQ